MNSEQFSGFLSSPGALNAQSLPLITELVKEYPYFQTAQLLLTKNLFNEKNIRYNAQLKIAAAYASDRKKLYELINGVEKTGKPVQPEPLKPEAVPEKAEQKPVLKPMEEPVAEKPVEQKEEKKQVAPETEKPVQKSILKPAEEPIMEKPVIAEPAKQEKPEPIVKKQAPKTDEKHTFTEWLRLAAIHSVTATEIDREKKKPAQKKEDLIDKFIRDEPKISKPQKTEFFSPANMARQSVVEDDELVTETLAVIYEKQGFYAKAIKAYEKLSLKYPEKKLSFAARIENLRQKLNEQ